MTAARHPITAFRRTSSRWLAGALFALGSTTPYGLFAQSAQVVVMSSYPDNVTSRFEEAFEETHPDIDMQILWRNSGDALAWLDQDGHAPVDVYWTPSPGPLPHSRRRAACNNSVPPSVRCLPRWEPPAFRMKTVITWRRKWPASVSPSIHNGLGSKE